MRRRTPGWDRSTRIGAVVTSVITVGVALIFSQTITRLLAPGGDIITATFVSVGQLRPGDKVRIGGVDVGRVDQVSLAPSGRAATVAMIVEDAGLPLYKNATAAIRWRTVLGGNLAVEVNRGTPAAGSLPAAGIPIRQTTNQVELDDVLTALRGKPQSGIRTMLDQTAKGLRDEAAPAAAIRSLAKASPDVQAGIAAARGTQPDDLEALVSTAAKTVRAMSVGPGEIRNVVEGGAATMGALARRRDDIAATLSAAATTFPQTRLNLAKLAGTLRLADPTLASLSDVSPQVAPTARELRPVVTGADRLLRRARPLLNALPPTARSLASLARSARPVVTGVRPSVDRANATILPGLAERDEVTKRTSYEMIGPSLAGISGSTAQYDGQGLNFLRFPASVRESAVDSLPCKPLLTDPDAASLVTCDNITDYLKTYFNYLLTPGKR